MNGMRVLLAATPGGGHVLPMIPVLDAFRAAGHDVALAISDDMVVPGLDEGVRRFRKGPSHFPLCPYPRGARRTAWWGRVNTEMAWASYLGTKRIIEDFSPDLVVRDAAERGAYLAAEVAGVPHVTVLAGSETVLTSYLRREQGITAPLRASLGLPEDPEGSTQVPVMGIVLTHPRFFGHGSALLANSRFYRGDSSLPVRDAGSDTGGPSVLVSLGSSLAVPHEEFARRALEGLAGTGVRVTVAVPDRFRARLAREFAGARILGFEDLAPHLDGADVVVSHGGFGTVQAALHRGVPMHITPFGSDQFFNAERISAQGLGVALPWESCTPARLAGSVWDVARGPSFRKAARAFAEDVRRLPGLDACVRDVISLI